jgi:hypothetical protein
VTTPQVRSDVHRSVWDRPRARRASLLLVVGLLVAPALIDADDFPLSTYPMYSSTRSSEVSFVTARGVKANGAVVSLGLATIGATDDPLIAAGELRAAIRAGLADDRCEEIAARLGPSRRDIVRIVIVTERRDAIEQTLGRTSLVERIVHASCRINSEP